MFPTGWSNCPHGTDAMQVLSTMFPGRLISCFGGYHLAHPLAWSCSTRLLPFGFWQKQGRRNKICQYWQLKPASLGVYSRVLEGKATMSQQPFHRDCRCVLNSMEVTKCHIQTVMIQMNSHGHGMYLLLLIPFFHFALKCYVTSKTIRCFWCTMYSNVVTISFRTLKHDPEQNMFQHSS